MKAGVFVLSVSILLGCSKDKAHPLPDFLNAAFLWTIDPTTIKTYGFTEHRSTGQNIVLIRIWTYTENEDWHVDQEITGNVNASKSHIRIISANTGEDWNVSRSDSTSITVETDSRESTWYSCKATGQWPAAIRFSTMGCN